MSDASILILIKDIDSLSHHDGARLLIEIGRRREAVMGRVIRQAQEQARREEAQAEAAYLAERRN